MKENYTHISVVLDASGSMHKLTHDTIGSFNQFLADQQAFLGEASFTLCTFAEHHYLVHNFLKIGDVPALNDSSYAPNGGTALLDALGHTIETVGQKLAALAESDRPSKVIVLIITDGEENSSRHYSPAKVKAMVEHQKDVYNWEFVFVGANIDAITAGVNLGVNIGNTANYVANSVGTKQLFSNISSNTTSRRLSLGPSKGNFFDQNGGLKPLPQK